ncbi:unnamed protein product [Cylicocyclus nassatus]|uniref:Uncharacterized protein n=1 Tax=Cylicocyclus nassatus TaxID=53992 RepID=A0AA36DIK5_CYLNA|nr:unnamed protein product [Cylicocyclus nassatus]
MITPLYTKYCGYIYIIDGNYWYYDYSKPYTYIYWYLNIALQAICVTIVVSSDSLIVWKIISLRSPRRPNTTHVLPKSSSKDVITPVLGSCEFPPCYRLRRRDRKLSKEIAAMFKSDVSFCCSCLENNFSPFKVITVSDDEEAMDGLYGKIGWELYRVKQRDTRNRLGVVCFRFFLKRLGGFPRLDFKYSSNLKGIVDVYR